MALRDNIKPQVTEKENKDNAREKVVRAADKRVKEKPKKFRVLRMWIHYVLSSMQKDRGKIPPDIGDRIMITNNIYITRYFMSSVIHVESLSLKTPIMLQSALVRHLRTNGCNAVVDCTWKNMNYDVQLNDAGLKSRISLWEQEAQSDTATQKRKEVSARCLYTVKLAKDGLPLYKTRMYITLRAKTGSELTAAEKLTYAYLSKIEAEYCQVTGDLKETLKYISILGDSHDSSIKDKKAIITAEQTLADMMPNSGSLNSIEGEFLGINVSNGSIFKLDWSKITSARNFYVYALSGHGKTVLVENMCASAFEDGHAVCVMDIKGNEFTNFINATGGHIVSLKQSSSGYINSWVMRKEDVSDENAESYFKQRVAFSKEQMLILSGVQDIELRNNLEEILDAFHNAYYINIGVSASNRNTWRNTLDINPYVIYEALQKYVTATVVNKYPEASRKILSTLKMYMSRNGSKSYIFSEEFDYAEVLRSNTLMFDFGLLGGTSELEDLTIFKLKFAYMRKLNAEYVAYKHRQGVKVLKVLEEAQVAALDDDILKGYIEEFTLRRAQGQTSVMLGNSVSALFDNPKSRPLIENITGLFIGTAEKEARDSLISKFGLEEYQNKLDDMIEDDRFENAFLFINKMQKKAAVPIIKVLLNPNREYKLFTAVAQSNNFIE